MRYYKIEIEDELFAVGVGADGTEITPEEYDVLKKLIEKRPHAPKGYEYYLTSSLEWKMREALLFEPELSDAEALDIILGGGVL